MHTTMDIAVKTVGELAVEMPPSIRVFEAWKIDYCCGGGTPLPAACAAVGKTIENFVAALESMTDLTGEGAPDWSGESLTSMAGKIVATYHGFTREELDAIRPLADKVLSVHGERRPELSDVVELIQELRNDMIPHMLKEEQVLFPYVQQLEEAAIQGRPAPIPFFGTVKNPVRKMMEEHDRVGELLASLRVVTDDYAPPESACFSYRELYRRLADFEKRTHEHIHIENNLFFPRAVSLEERAGQPAPFGDTCGSGCRH